MIKDTDKIKHDQSVWVCVGDLNGDVSIDYSPQANYYHVCMYRFISSEEKHTHM
jgi:hypothetical protein